MTVISQIENIKGTYNPLRGAIKDELVIFSSMSTKKFVDGRNGQGNPPGEDVGGATATVWAWAFFFFWTGSWATRNDK